MLDVWRANSLPSTENTPVPPLPGPGPSYLKSKTIVCLPGFESFAQQVVGSHAPFPAVALQIEEVVNEDRLAFEQVETVAAEAAAQVTIMPSAPPSGIVTSAVMV